MSQTIVLISNANQGIDLAPASRLAREYGYRVIIGSRNADNGFKAAKQLQSDGLLVDSMQLDVTSDDSIANAAEYIGQKYGRLDVLVNNAGILLDRNIQSAITSKMPLRQKWDLTLSTNFTGTACLTEAMIPLLCKSTQRPRVIFLPSRMASSAESLNPNTIYYQIDYKMYDASKAALNMLVTSYAHILGEEMKASVNAVCPSLIQTNFTGYMAQGEKPEM